MQTQTPAKTLLPALVRAISNSNGAKVSSVAVAKSSPSGGNFLSLLGFGSARVTTPLSEPLPGLQPPLKGSVPKTQAKLQSSELAGVRVASIATPSPVTTVALVVGGGSAVETAATAGASKVLEAMAFKATHDRTTFRVTRELEKIGAVAYAHAGRDHISFAIDAVKLNTPEATEILLDTVLNARLQYHEVRDIMALVKSELSKALANPEYALTEMLHRVAYEGPLGQPLIVDPSTISMTYTDLQEFHASLMHPSNLMLAGIGAEHEELKNLAGPLLSSALTQGKPALAPAPSTYVGGSANVVASSPLAHVALAFEAKGGIADAQVHALSTVAKILLDDSECVLPWSTKDSEVVEGMSSFAHMYKSSGLVGVMACAAPSKASALVDAVYKKVTAVANGVTDARVAEAKAVAISSFKAQTASSCSALPIISSQMMATGKYDEAAFTSAVAAITPASLLSFVKSMVKASPTMVTYGPLANLPRYESIAKRLA
mmetsp:Transcript_13367/g.38813  ORF Transcript_13367/g.38813 Transcript_13367/m.38813 type:complete len:490 (-) Transcript_13367:139-1608(-)|eukprot:352421-Chlamydomonas_euryale.AAC.12